MTVATLETVDQSLPDALRPAAEVLVELITVALANRLSLDELQQRIAADPALPLVVHALAGQTLLLNQSSQAQIIFGPGAQTGDITIAGDVVGGSKLVLTANVFYPAPEQHTTPEPTLACPYPGLNFFTEDKQPFFFGRSTEVKLMLDRLVGRRAVVVLGPSGSGKTSAVLADLLPKVRVSSRFGPGVWHLTPMVRLRGNPLGALEAVFGDLSAPTHAIDRMCDKAQATRILLVIDALEELFTQTPEILWPQTERILRDLLRNPRLFLVVTVRADYYHRLITGLPLLWERFQHCLVTLGPLTAGGLAQVIVGPAAQCGVQVETDLVAVLVSEALGDRREAAILPFLQETLVQLWDAREGGPLTVTAYDHLGDRASERSGLQVALASHAAHAMESLHVAGDPTTTAWRLAAARRILLRLLQFTDDGRVLRRLQDYNHLLASGDSPDTLDSLLRDLSDQRLLSIEVDAATQQQQVDLVHEALITGWPDLQRWIAVYGDAERLRRKLEDQARLWDAAKQPRTGPLLLERVALDVADTWLVSEPGVAVGHSALLRTYLDASRSALSPPWNRRGAALLALAMAGSAALLALLALLGASRTIPVALALALGLGLVITALSLFRLVTVTDGRYASGRRLAQVVGTCLPAGLAAGTLGLGAAAAWALVGVPVAQREWACGNVGYTHPAPGIRSLAILDEGQMVPFYATIVRDVLASYSGVTVQFVPRTEYERCATFFTHRLQFTVGVEDEGMRYEAQLTPSTYGSRDVMLPDDEPVLQCKPLIGLGQAIAADIGLRLGSGDVAGQLASPVGACSAVDLNNEGYVDYKEERYDAAIVKLDQAIVQLPGLAAAYHNRGLVRLATREYARAVNEFRTAISILRQPLFLLNLGAACRYIGDHSCIEVNYREAIELDPTFFWAYNNLGAYYLDEGRLEEAESMFTEAAKQIEKSSDAAWIARFVLNKNLAILHYLREEFEVARQELDQVDKERFRYSDLQDLLGTDFHEEILFYRAATYQRLGSAFACDLWVRYRALPDSGLIGEAERERQAETLEAELRHTGRCQK